MPLKNKFFARFQEALARSALRDAVELYDKEQTKSWIWILERQGPISSRKAHYELMGSESEARVEIHFEGYTGKDQRDTKKRLYRELETLSYPPGIVFGERQDKPGKKERDKSIQSKSYTDLEELVQVFEGLVHFAQEHVYPILTKMNLDATSIDAETESMTNETPDVKRPRNVILYGPPGTGKTYEIQNKWIHEYCSDSPQEGEENERYVFVTFHQSYGYEEFVEGIRSIVDDSGQVTYKPIDGVFKSICDKAAGDRNNRYAIFIDEINRGNISKIFGELITLIEVDKRSAAGDKDGVKGGVGPIAVTLPYSGESFSVPDNLDIIGTMNTADRSIALMDVALRRRFEFKELMPDASKIEGDDRKTGVVRMNDDEIDLRALLDALNKRIRFLIGREYQLGHAFFCSVKTADDLHDCFANKIIPMLQEYFYSNWEHIRLVLGDSPEQRRNVGSESRNYDCFILSDTLDAASVLGVSQDEHAPKDDFRVNPNLMAGTLSPLAYRKIYELSSIKS